ncbi:ubiquitin carboxyl-terminal hydrolase 30-like [Mytilus trossulus]|uniref:ubiquitin carboxyl-terminal hydrolase 30-like n=1 Tax=Mytilus trossulus TaxID=6551 RepID=UPI0030072D32
MKINRFSSTKQTIWLYVAGPSLGVIALITLGLITWKLRKKIKNCCKGSPKEESTEISSTRSVVVEVNDDIRNKGPQPKMLENLGNTCYMNAILQTLAWCPYLENELEKLELNEKCEMTNSILRLLKYTHSEEPKQFDPNEVLHIAREKNNRFEGNNQQDCFEMYNTIIETMTNEIRALQEVNCHQELS